MKTYVLGRYEKRPMAGKGLTAPSQAIIQDLEAAHKTVVNDYLSCTFHMCILLFSVTYVS